MNSDPLSVSMDSISTPFIKNLGINKEQKQLAIKELLKKCSIIANGCRKKGNTKEAEYYENIINQYS